VEPLSHDVISMRDISFMPEDRLCDLFAFSHTPAPAGAGQGDVGGAEKPSCGAGEGGEGVTGLNR
jgi:hypothetical protein